MKVRSDFVWAVLLLGTAVISFFLGARKGRLDTGENFRDRIGEETEKISVLENKVQQLSEELISRGIYSYPQANVISEKDDTTATVVVVLNGRESIPNLKIERKPTENFSAENTDTVVQTVRKRTISNIGNLTAHNPVAFELGTSRDNIDVNLKFISGRNVWHQYIRARKTPDGELKNFWVITNKESEVIDKHIDKGFPLDENGSLVFDPGRTVKYSEVRMNSVFLPERQK